MLEIFREAPIQPYQMKDLERIAPKAKSITRQSVKEVVMDLVYDNLVNQEKIGTSTYFWSFPSELAQQKNVKLADLRKESDKVTHDSAAYDKEIMQLQSSLKASGSSPSKLHQLSEKLEGLKKRKAELLTAIEDEGKGDENAELHRKRAALTVMKDGVNRWTDNIAIVKSYFVKKQGMDAERFNSWWVRSAADLLSLAHALRPLPANNSARRMGIRGGSFFESVE